MKVYIRANSPYGLPVATRGGRQWPTGATKEVELIEGDEDPQIETTVDGRKVKQPDPDRINKKTLELIKNDARFSVLQNPESEADLAAAKAEISSLRHRVAELEGQLGIKSSEAGKDDVTAGGETTEQKDLGSETRDEGHRGKRGR